MNANSDDDSGYGQALDELVEEVTSRNEVAYHVYSDLWKNFYDWELAYSQSIIDQILPSSHIKPPSLPSSDTLTWKEPIEEHEDWATIDCIDQNIGRHTQAVVSWEPLTAAKIIPYPRYTFCTPQSYSVKAEKMNRAKFAAYADDSKFNLKKFLHTFEDFMWQNDFPDPNLEMLEMEATRRLLYKHGFSAEDIDNLGILTFPLQGENGLLWYANQRDYPWWTGSQQDEIDNLPTHSIDPTLDLYENILKDSQKFCDNFNCLYMNCSLHGTSHPIVTVDPKMTSNMIKQTKGSPCNTDCYKSVEEDNINMINAHWSADDKALFASVMKFIPDARPCDLAVICRKPCVEMYVERVNFFRDEDIDIEDEGTGRIREMREVEFEEDQRIDPEKIAIMRIAAGPCCHPGPCNQYADCECYRHKQRCLRNCRCSTKCELRYKGCKCRPSKRDKYSRKQCCMNEEQCLCRKLQRECDPEMCTGCGARRIDKGKCANMNIQKGNFVPIHIKESQHGLGAFATCNIKEDTPIGEYVGEMSIDNASFTLLQNHVGLNYTFDLVHNLPNENNDSNSILLDSWNLGNETRYLNHSEEANCGAITVYVNGCHRIMLFAKQDIKAGTELTLDYGIYYWKTPEKKKEIKEVDFDPNTIQWATFD